MSVDNLNDAMDRRRQKKTIRAERIKRAEKKKRLYSLEELSAHLQKAFQLQMYICDNSVESGQYNSLEPILLLIQVAISYIKVKHTVNYLTFGSYITVSLKMVMGSFLVNFVATKDRNTASFQHQEFKFFI